MQFDELFPYIGQFHVYQASLVAVLGTLSLYTGYQIMAMTFLAAQPKHWCKVDRLVKFPNDQQKEIAIPYVQNSSHDDRKYARCMYFNAPYDRFSDAELWMWNRTIAERKYDLADCEDWVFDQSVFTRTASSEFTLVCQYYYKVDLMCSIAMVGVLIGAPVSGYLSGRYGRRIILLVGCVFHFTFAVAAAFAPSYFWFVVFRFLFSFFNGFAYLTGFVIIMEIVGPRYRTLAGVCYYMEFALGIMVLSMMAYFVRDFRYLQLFMAAPMFLTACYVLLLLDESPRWLVSQGRYEEAKHVLKKIADINHKELPQYIEFDAPPASVATGTLSDLLGHSILRRILFIISFAWITNNMVYFGLNMNIGGLVGNLFFNTFLFGLAEIPANLVSLFAMQYTGRKRTLSSSYFFAAIATTFCVPLLAMEELEGLAWMVTILSMLGKSAITVAFGTIYIYSAELFPTPIRHLAMASASMMSRFGRIIAPFFGGTLDHIWKPLPSVVFGAMTLAAGIMTLFLPETLNRKLPDTMEEAEDIARDKKYQFSKDTDMKTGENAAISGKLLESNVGKFIGQ